MLHPGRIKKPRQKTMATWRRGDDNLEPSAMMLAIIEQLQIAEDHGDKRIGYSQCMRLISSKSSDVGLVGDYVSAVREPECAVRREVAERGSRRGVRGVPQDGQVSIKCGGVGLNLTAAKVRGDLHLIETFYSYS